MQDDHFEWDDVKARDNLEDHKISFEDAKLVFDDPCGLDLLDEREDYGEDRVNRTGLTGIRLFTVTYVERGQRVRIIFRTEGDEK